MDEEALRAMLPMGFGKQAPRKGKASIEIAPEPQEEYDSAEESDGPGAFPQVPSTRPAPQAAPVPELEPEAEPTPAPAPVHELSDEEQEATRKRARHDPAELGVGRTLEYAGLPLEHNVSLKDHTKTISALAVDPSGTRVATGSHDYEVKLWDFGGMTQSFRPFRTWEPAENYPVVQLDFSPISRNLLCVNATTQPRVYDYQGDELAVYRKGDVFMRDMKHTTGHVTEATCGAWHPTDTNTFMTGGSDSTIRVWDIDFLASQKIVIVVRSKERGTKTKVTAATYTPDARAIVAACQDGALHMWSTSGSYARPSATVERAHANHAGASGLAVASDSVTVASRGMDDTVKLWDLRSLKRPVAVQENVPCSSEHCEVVFSPNNEHVVTGTAAIPRQAKATATPDDPADLLSEWGQLAVFSGKDLAQELVHPVDRSSVTRLCWQPRINQVLAATRAGAVHVYYDDEASQLGAKLGVKRRDKVRANPFGIEQLANGHAPDVPIFMPDDEDAVFETDEQRIHKLRRDPVKTKLPQMPVRGQGRGGRIGTSETTHLIKDMYLDQAQLRMQDPREALLKYADKAEKDPRWTSIYAKTQPKTIYSKETGDEE
ncbi:uncharacterized protein MJAP1_002249 [Malassezia japonica]|uniref:Uncharacterized protein n=1 Tax=Malassezia japonica TaxID=223818 RepID=A0AAF0F6G6_9BASI|nr:uncharacterized protein MJAP1_002249 [Malassezia japonica]WFD39278.1 hypothetical protein MJAP1_002249 [Malassezia japonica]